MSSTTTPRLKPILKDVETFNSIISTTQTPINKRIASSTGELNGVHTDISSSQLNGSQSAEVENSGTGRASFTLSLETVSTGPPFLDDDELPDLIVETEDKKSNKFDSLGRFSPGEETSRDCVGSNEMTELVSENIINQSLTAQTTVCTSDLGLSLTNTSTSLNSDPTATESYPLLMNIGSTEEKVRTHVDATSALVVSSSTPTPSETVRSSECGTLSGTLHSSAFKKMAVDSGSVLPCLVKPMLSSGSFIDLDDDDDEGNHKMEVGVNGLMERMFKHSRTTVAKKPKHVELT